MKLLDRCNNVSFMAHGFSPSKLGEYIEETKSLFYRYLQKQEGGIRSFTMPVFY